MAPTGFWTSTHVPMYWSCLSSVWIMHSYSSQSWDARASFKLWQLSLGIMVNTSSLATETMPTSFSSGKGSFRYL